jgi:hypothetical protein
LLPCSIVCGDGPAITSTIVPPGFRRTAALAAIDSSRLSERNTVLPSAKTDIHVFWPCASSCLPNGGFISTTSNGPLASDVAAAWSSCTRWPAARSSLTRSESSSLRVTCCGGEPISSMPVPAVGSSTRSFAPVNRPSSQASGAGVECAWLAALRPVCVLNFGCAA